MNIDEIVKSIPDEDSKLRADLRHWIEDWKLNDGTIEELSNLVRKWHGNVWFKSQESSNEFYEQWKKFEIAAIEGLGGLTMNERLYWFGLFEAWDRTNEIDHKRIRVKLKANT